MQTEISQLIFFAALAIVLTLVSGLIPVLKVWKEDHLHGFVSFSAGVLLATAFLHILPDAIVLTPVNQIGGWILLSFLTLFVLEKFVMLHPCEESHCDYHTIGLAAFVGMTVHTLFDGFILGASLHIQNLGPVIFFALMAHKVPSSFSLGSILRKAEWPVSRIVLFIFLFSLVIPAGAVISWFVLSSPTSSLTGPAMALSLGTFIYIATSDFLPEVHRAHAKRFQNFIYLFGGIGAVAATVYLVPGH